MPLMTSQADSYHGYTHAQFSFILLFFLLVITFSTGIAEKKIFHFDHNGNHVQSLCWTLKLKEGQGHLMLQQGRQFPLSSTNIRLISIGQISNFQNHLTVCYCPENLKNSEILKFPILHKVYRQLFNEDHDSFVLIKESVENLLEGDTYIEWFSPYVVRSRQKREIQFKDPFFSKQWHLKNRMLSGMDINVTGVWEHNITGVGVTVAVVDDGLEWSNPDLQSNYNRHGSWDLNDDDPDPMPSNLKATNHHGTRCAGEIAAVANTVCGVGVAYEANISGLRVLDGPMTDSLEASAFNKKMEINDIYSCSWGPDDDGKTVDGPHILAAKAMKYGVDFGRHGYGSIYVVASGNGGHRHDNCNYDGYANSIYTFTIGAVDESGQMPYYAEECASMLGVTFSSGQSGNRAIVTTDWRIGTGTGCTEHHTGTSAAAPLAAGMIALMLQARPCLTWRDVQYLMILTAVKVDVDIAHWQKNGAGLYHSHKHGFGLLKAWGMVNAAKVWETVPWITSYSVEGADVNTKIPRGRKNSLRVSVTVDDYHIQGYSLYILEHVQVTVTITHPCRGTLGIRLICPSGTESVIGAPRPNDNSTLGFSDWTFTTVRCWGEKPTGTYHLVITDKDKATSESGVLKYWRLTLFGTPMMPHEFLKRRQLIADAMSGVYLNDSYQRPCPPPPVIAEPVIPMSQRTLKMLALVCVFCAVMCVYESLEYAFCYNDEKKQHRRKLKLAARAHRLAGSNTDANTADDATESTGLLQSEDIPMEILSMTSPTATSGVNCDSGDNVLYSGKGDNVLPGEGGDNLYNGRGDNLFPSDRGNNLSSGRGDNLYSGRGDNLYSDRGDNLYSDRGDNLYSDRGDNLYSERGDNLYSGRTDKINKADNQSRLRTDMFSYVDDNSIIRSSNHCVQNSVPSADNSASDLSIELSTFTRDLPVNVTSSQENILLPR